MNWSDQFKCASQGKDDARAGLAVGEAMLTETPPRRPWRQIADLILSLAAAEGLRAGARLPAERDLAERLGVSRPSLREALIALEVEGRVEIRKGSGIYVAEGNRPAAAARLESEGPFEILEARAVLESAIAEEAARRVTPALIATLDANLRDMAAATDDRARAIPIDAAFHEAIANGTGNALLSRLTSDIFAKRLSPLFSRLAAHFEGPPTWRSALAEHGAIRDAIAAGDPAGAREAMRRHLTLSRRRFSETFAEARAAQAQDA